ncbi:MAG TPA: hypothetical protein VFT45_00835 [Longimicrobium sp.]|nr:hypothetical protein [Longimicrobium sp.]
MREEQTVPGIESYDLAEVGEAEAQARSFGRATRPVLRMTIHGPGFPVRAVDPVVAVDGRRVFDFEIAEDQESIVAWLDVVPPEGASIEVRYGQGPRALSPEPFTISKLGGPPPVA